MSDPRVTVVCAWCGSGLQDGLGGAVSHGICANCSAAFLAEAERSAHPRAVTLHAGRARLARRFHARRAAIRRVASRLCEAAAALIVVLVAVCVPPSRQP